uniref:NADH dehydrogenase subunit 6 n=1 Tax=Liposcelis bostrychophila TaxID=185214 RepID=A0A3S6PU89_LIPBO|nr:NADH dehydrogenase subunit 6 [Liposcelis bostrychophila]ATU74603.1 NADH dehydrogenase subunit 6 [Liposcelis bostrychophila]UNO31817.1 NADH dehydrogenase subunit 6 [Liposcelis bostrychophila]
MVLNLMWMMILYVMIVFTLENFMFSALVYVLVAVFLCSGMMAIVSNGIWMSMIFLIFMVGGLMVSFFYMVSLSHNMVLVWPPLILLFSLLLSPFSYKSLENFHEDSVDYFSFSSLGYMMEVLFMLFLLFLILFMIDYKLKTFSGFLKEI